VNVRITGTGSALPGKILTNAMEEAAVKALDVNDLSPSKLFSARKGQKVICNLLT
jgi:3-oxoacyl-[acyl-carrier-protein] synthase III